MLRHSNTHLDKWTHSFAWFKSYFEITLKNKKIKNANQNSSLISYDWHITKKWDILGGYASYKKSNSEFWSAFFFNEFEIWFKSCKRMDRGPEYLISWWYASHKKSNLNSGLHFLFFYFLKWFRNMI
jgi:hypothetical protein